MKTVTSASLRRVLAFAGPSLCGAPPHLIDQVELRGPARRGDLEALLDDEPGVVLLVDGLFGTSLAVTVTECRELLERGWTIVGAGSIGAVRAAELFPAGMIGIGDVYALLRLGVLTSDADVAVAYEPDTYCEISVAMVHVRAALASVTGLSAADRAALLAAARHCYWMERSAAMLAKSWSSITVDPAAVESLLAVLADPEGHPKRRDGLLALRCILSTDWLAPVWP